MLYGTHANASRKRHTVNEPIPGYESGLSERSDGPWMSYPDEMVDDVCGCEWDDRDDPSIPLGGGYSCTLAWEHDGPHRFGDFEWEG